jgi:hypothetical protein
MDLRRAIRALYEEKQRIEASISLLEELLRSGGGSERRVPADLGDRKQRGRKTMSPEERRVVSERMKRYWARRRAGSARASAGSSS